MAEPVVLNVLSKRVLEIQVDNEVVAVCRQHPVFWSVTIGAVVHQVSFLEDALDLVPHPSRPKR